MSDHVGMRKLRARWLGVAVAFIVLAAGAAWLGAFLSRRGLDQAAKLSEVASFVLAAGAVLLPAAGRVVRWLPAPRLKDEQIDADVADLAAALRIQGRIEGPLSGLSVYDRLPMPVRWRGAAEFSSASGAGAQDAGFADRAEGLTGTFDEVLEYFRQLPESRIVVLGPAGSGKTVLATELARRLLAARQPSDPVPVIIPAAAWDPNQTALFDWVAEQLIRINSGLAQRVRDGRGDITRAQALVDRMKVLPILDGLDEVAKASRSMATIAVNRYGWSQPLVVTYRSDEYLRIVGVEHGTPVARAAVVMLMPLELADIKAYLGPDWDGHWTAVYGRLDDEPRGALAEVLANPLMLWLAWAVYSSPGRSPAELADARRFATRTVIEHHLLAEFVPAVYRDSRDRPRRLRRLLPASGPPLRWLGFLASDPSLHSKTPDGGNRPSVDSFETRDLQNVAWWRFTGPRGLRVLGVAIRAALLLAALWGVIVVFLMENGYWHDGAYAGPLQFRKVFLSGPVGQRIWPTIRQLILLVPRATRQHAYSAVGRFPQDYFSSPAALTATAVVVALLASAIIAGVYSSEIVIRPSYIHIRPRLLVSWLIGSMQALIVVAAAMWFVMVFWHHSNLVFTFFGQQSTWFTILVIALALSVPRWPFKLVAKADVVGAVNPVGSLRLDRWADVIVTISRRVVFAGVVVLFSGPQLALAYIAFAVACTGVALVFGGQISSKFASRSYSDARIWLAITRQMPWRPMRFLADAERRGVFQDVGAVFRFRHARVQRQLQDWHDVYRPRTQDLWLRYLRVIDRLQARTGDYAYSLAGARDRVDGFRTLAAQNLEEFGPDLVMALNTQAGFLRELGYLDDELEALRQLVTTRRLLAEVDPKASPALAESLGQLAFRLADAGRHDEAVAAMTEAAEIFCLLAAAKSDAFRSHLANSLIWLMRISVKLERSSDADRAVTTIVAGYAELVRAELDRDQPSHMASLTWLASLLERLGREDDAATEVNEAVTAYAKLPRSGPNADPAGHAKSLVELAKILEDLGRKGDASRAATYSAEIYRDLARLEPAKYGPLFVESLTRLARLYKKMGRSEELNAVREAVSIYRDLAASGWNLYVDTLSNLYSLALRLWKLGAQQEAIEAIKIGDLMAGVGAQRLRLWMWTGLEPYEWRRPPTRPDSRSFFSWLTRVKGDESWEKARAADWRFLADDHDTRAFRLLLAGQDQESQAEIAKAVDCSRELVRVCRHLASTRPADHLADLADSLELLARQLSKGQSGEAAADAAASEAELIRCQLGLERARPVTDASGDRPTPEATED